ncbi:MAG: restriction endonuclease, partial [Flavobacterium sp.]
YWEHCNELIRDDQFRFDKQNYTSIFPKRRGDDLLCFELNKKTNNDYQLNTGYFIGLDWIKTNETALFVAPKLNSKHYNSDLPNEVYEIDFISMFFSAIQHSDVSKELEELIIVKWEEPNIEISQKQDLLTPFLVIEFLNVLKIIVRKGLKKNYYKVETNINGRIKGKVMISKTIKYNNFKNKSLFTYCKYEEFGLNNNENKLLKKALTFVKKYLPVYCALTDSDVLQNTFNYINPAFENINEDIELPEIKQNKTNSLYREYDTAIRLAKLILKKFGYNITNTVNTKITSPPFWIDMSKLFELYTLGLLKDEFKNDIQYQFKDIGNELDFILNTTEFKMVLDAKYKLKYLNGQYDEDVRQVSGYARLKSVYQYLDKKYPESIDCLIIHPDQENGVLNFKERNLNKNQIQNYNGIYKIGIKLPLRKKL